ncbi:hypothetical protein [Victivallis vadensis]|uniref:hypothetical protein n=1 Tax=Victivallis vadensis TaxID=172901 RepID=UPI003AF73F5A
MRKLLVWLPLCSALFAGCVGSPHPAGACESYYPELPDNEHCFRKIAEYRAFLEKSDDYEVTGGRPDAGGEAKFLKVLAPPCTLEGYLGILEGRGAIVSRQVVVTSEQSRTIFKSRKKLPDFLVEVTGSFDWDPSRYRVVTFYCRKGSEGKFQAWFDELIPPDTLPKENSGMQSVMPPDTGSAAFPKTVEGM